MTHVTERVGAVVAARAARLQTQMASPVRTQRTAVVLGRLLAATFVICFLTGLYSHILQEPLPWMRFPTRPVWLYQATQGIHVTIGLAIFPLLFGKLWTVYPKLFVWPPFRSPVELLERLSIAVLVATALLEPTIGLLNTFHWYPWSFSFKRAHFSLAWVIVGSIAIHVAVKLPVIVRHWRGRKDDARTHTALRDNSNMHRRERS